MHTEYLIRVPSWYAPPHAYRWLFFSKYDVVGVNSKGRDCNAKSQDGPLGKRGLEVTQEPQELTPFHFTLRYGNVNCVERVKT